MDDTIKKPIRALRQFWVYALSAFLLASSPMSVWGMGCDIVLPLDDEVGGGDDDVLNDDEPQPCGMVGNPINLVSGNKFQEEVDYIGKGVSPISLTRVYNSYDGVWRHNYSDNLSIGQFVITYVRADGTRRVFMKKGLTPLYGAAGKLSSSGTGYLYTAMDGSQLAFDSDGKLISTKDTEGLTQTLTYSANNTVTVKNIFGQTLVMTLGMLSQLTSAKVGGLSITYNYAADATRLMSLSKIVDGKTLTRQYHYEVPNARWLLTGITDERGIRFATWKYDDSYRAISSEHAEGVESSRLDYKDHLITVVTNELGKQTTYKFKEVYYSRRIVEIIGEPTPSCPYSNSKFEYDKKGRMSAKIDNMGVRSEYYYNDRDLLVRTVVAVGTSVSKETLTEWHATFQKPIKVTTPTRITTYSYDAQGRLVNTSVVSRV
ncbi:DUF6531 domain-containing protein [Pseudomonas sp. KFB-139]|uniref:DUF6531 domain-containing protein n=1 Tax=Pseudomonas serbiensis TaxID=3064350 RepID=A0ABT9CIH0_9PSED|nr:MULTISPECIES: DUF6531 domain-containing protein [Pseudomonas]MDO7925283.1 DUF6531 domain-containing protein [Pseudomonas sp. KFB-138]